MILNTWSHSRRGRRQDHLSALMMLALFLAASALAPTAWAQDDDDDPTWANELTPRSGINTPPGRWLPLREQQRPSTLTEEQQR